MRAARPGTQAMAATVLALLWPGVLPAEAPVTYATAPPAGQEDILTFVQPDGGDQTERYLFAARDLNGDGLAEALVRIEHRAWCQPDMRTCITLVLTHVAGGNWTPLGEIPAATLTPGPQITAGWRDLVADGRVWSMTDGPQPRYAPAPD